MTAPAQGATSMVLEPIRFELSLSSELKSNDLEGTSRPWGPPLEQTSGSEPATVTLPGCWIRACGVAPAPGGAPVRPRPKSAGNSVRRTSRRRLSC
jgi:hypothetical protein